MTVRSFRDLVVWQKSLELTKSIYIFTENLPKEEQFGLVSQIKRSAVSIPSNIAEGEQRHSRKEYRQFIGIARGSAAELETQLLLTEKIYDVDIADLKTELHTIQKMLHALANRLQPIPNTKSPITNT